MSKQNPVVKDSLTPQDRTAGDSVRRLVRNFGFCHEIEGYLVVSPSAHKGGTPQILDFKKSNGEADRRAAHLERVYGKPLYPNGLIVVPCEVHFSIPLDAPAKPMDLWGLAPESEHIIPNVSRQESPGGRP